MDIDQTGKRLCMRILQLCKKFPYPIKDGESLAINYLSKAYIELGAEVTLFSMNTARHRFESDEMPQELNHYKSVHFAEVDNSFHWWEAILNLMSNDSYHISRFVSENYEKMLIKILQSNKFDVVQLETLYLAPYIPTIRKYSKAKVVMRAHNVESEIWERVANNTKDVIKKWYLSYLTKKLQRFEIEQLNNYDLLLPITERDGQQFRKLGYIGKISVIPIGLDNRDYLADDSCFKHPLSVSFIGSLDWAPNLDGITHFIKEYWPKITQKYPQTRLYVAGRNTPKSLNKLGSNQIEILGEVADAKHFINKHPVMIVPIHSGSGMRAKILEGMALGRVIITTSIGLEGIAAKHKEHLLIADTVEEFLECMEYCYQLGEQLVHIGNRAQVLVARNYNNLEIAKKALLSFGYQTPAKATIS